jgi:DNA-binding CsgD family transcriptional regulator
VGVESEAHLPFGGLHHLLRPLLAAVDALPVRQRDALMAAFGMGAVTAPPEIFLIGLASLDLLAERASGSRVLVVVEDAHWLDGPSCDVLAFIARRIELEPIGMLFAMRALSESRFAGIDELRVESLDEATSAALLDARARGLTPALRQRVLNDADGNPLALVELPLGVELAGESDPLPLTERLERAFASRLADLPARGRVALLAAALDDAQQLETVLGAASSAVGVRMTLDDLAPAVEARLVVVGDDGVRFRHPLIRSAVFHAATRPERRAIHAALADVLAADADRRAWHVAAACDGPNEEAAALLEEAATRAQGRGGMRTAVTALQRAATLTPDRSRRGARLLRAAELAFEAGEHGRLIELIHDVEAIELGGSYRGRLALVREFSETGSRSQPLTQERVLALVELAQEASRQPDGHDLAVNLLWAAASRSYWTDPGRETRLRLVAAAEGIASPERDPRVVGILAFAAPVERGAAVVDHLSRFASSPGTSDGIVAPVLAAAAYAVGALDLAAGFLIEGVAELRAEGRVALLVRALAMQARTAIHLGQLATAVAIADEAGRLAEETDEPLFAAGAKLSVAIVDAVRGDDGTMEARIAEAEAVALPVGAGALLAPAQFARGLAAIGAGRYDDAYDQLCRMFDRADGAFHPMESIWAIGDLAEAAIRCGRANEARGLLVAHEPIAAQTSAARVQIAFRYARAVLAEDDHADALYQAALAAPLALWPFDRGRLLLAYGAWLRRQRRVAESRAPLRAASQTFDALGASPWSERARQELRASGETARERRVELREQLSPQELQIARMAVEGLTNREIGQQLYLSHRTVASHLYRVFPKLGITSRNQLRAAIDG